MRLKVAFVLRVQVVGAAVVGLEVNSTFQLARTFVDLDPGIIQT